MHRTVFIGLALVATILAGCSTQVVNEAERHASETRAEASQHATRAAVPLPPADLSPIKVHSGVYMGSKSRLISYGTPLPTSVESSSGIAVAQASPMTLQEIAAAITKASGIPVVVASKPEYVEDDEEGTVDEGTFQEALSSMQGGIAPGGSSQEMIRASTATATKMRINYSGSLSGLLDMVSAHFNVGWRHEAGNITLSWTITRTFSVPALPSAVNMNFSMESEGGTDSDENTARAGLSSDSSFALDVWTDIRDGLAGIIGDGGSYSASLGTGTVTVTARPSVMNRVTEYLATINKKLSKQVAVNVQVLSVTFFEEDNYNLDLGVLFNGSSRLSGGLGSAAASALAAGGDVVTGGGAGLGWALIGPDSNWSGTQGIVDALSERGNVSVMTSASVTTLSGIPVPIQVGNVRDYVAERNATADEGVVSTSVTTKQVTTGFNLNLAPNILDNGGILMQYGVSMSELVGQDGGFDVLTLDDAGSQVMLANKDLRNFVQQAVVPNRSTLVVAGFERYRTESSKSGTGSPDFPLLGGGQSGKMKREVIVIVITPTILDMDRALAAN